MWVDCNFIVGMSKGMTKFELIWLTMTDYL